MQKFNVGDKVRVIRDFMKISNYFEEKYGWSDEMMETAGESATVLHYFNEELGYKLKFDDKNTNAMCGLYDWHESLLEKVDD